MEYREEYCDWHIRETEPAEKTGEGTEHEAACGHSIRLFGPPLQGEVKELKARGPPKKRG